MFRLHSWTGREFHRRGPAVKWLMFLQVVIELTVFLSILLAIAYYHAAVRRHLADLVTLTPPRPSPSRRSGRDIMLEDLRHRRDVTAARLLLDNGVVRLYNRRRRQYVAVATRRDDVTAMTSRRARRSYRGHSVHFSSELSCSTCESVGRCCSICSMAIL